MIPPKKGHPLPGKKGATKKHVGAEFAAPVRIVAHQRLLNTKSAASYLGISPRTLWTLASLGEIASVRFSTGGRETVRYDVSDLDAFIDGAKA